MTAFLFGKLPVHGDFVARHLGADEREALDMWLSAEMAAARAEAGMRFDGLFDAAPVWQFALPDASAWRVGALAPSVDAVGRRFPLMLGWTNVDEASAGAAADFAETTLFSAISEGWNVDRLAVLEPPPAYDPSAPRTGWWTDASAATFTNAHPTGLLRAMLATVPA